MNGSPTFVRYGTRAVVAPFVFAAGLAAIALAPACAQTQRALGEDCLKDQDCLSGICSQLKCAAAPPLLDGASQAPPSPTPEAGVADAPEAEDSGGDASGDAPVDAAAEAAAEGSMEASPEPAPDAPAE
jgi:hypothetical protein